MEDAAWKPVQAIIEWYPDANRMCNSVLSMTLLSVNACPLDWKACPPYMWVFGTPDSTNDFRTMLHTWASSTTELWEDTAQRASL